MSSPRSLRLTALALCFGASALALAADNKITPTLESVQVQHNGQTVTIQRGHDLNATLPDAFQKTDRGCPPFCVQPMTVVEGVETIGELEVLNYLHRMSQGDKDILLVDSRTPDWVMRGTIPGSVNIPWNRISRDNAGTFETPREADTFEQTLRDDFSVIRDPASGALDFSKAKTLVLFCNGIWCPQSTANIKTLVGIGYPLHKLKWYRGGMQDWLSVGLTSVQP
ncbi:rhodanese-like domain-containing protein [Allochromatium vinosum]|uniref:Sulfur transferase, periplasm n=2 Tax=Allochromatium vinosum TaxID=1049 RepID=D3RVS9_ALLVD|nr:rhodanese-like domain-containing protein [Allochromatium vinosum]ABE01363.1 putative rhodanese precursor [Allochromatium vinosum]ADC63092.1 sulfur transferase, periplasm [Allochromatium vinosum DSM 180]